MKLLLIALLIAHNTLSQSLDIEQFYSSEEASVTKLTLSRDFGQYQLWGFVENFLNDDDYANFSEFRLSYKFNETVSFQAEHNDILGSDNDVLRFGLVLSKRIGQGTSILRLFPYETGNEAYQASLIWYYPVGKWYVLGFFDLDIYQDIERVVCEPSVGYRLENNWSVIMRYTYNDYTNAIVNDQNTVTIGFAYAIQDLGKISNSVRHRLFPAR